MNTNIIATGSLALAIAAFASSGVWAQTVTPTQTSRTSSLTQTTAIPPGGPALCHMVWAAADKGQCLNGVSIADGGRLDTSTGLVLGSAAR